MSITAPSTIWPYWGAEYWVLIYHPVIERDNKRYQTHLSLPITVSITISTDKYPYRCLEKIQSLQHRLGKLADGFREFVTAIWRSPCDTIDKTLVVQRTACPSVARKCGNW